MLTITEETALQSILEDADDAITSLRKWDREFIADIQHRYEQDGAATIITGRMWIQLRRIEEFVNAL